MTDRERRKIPTYDLAKLKSACEVYGDEKTIKQLQDDLIMAAQAVIDRWETPLWKDVEPTATVIYRLRDALDKLK